MQITPQSGVASPIDLLPRGFLAWAKVTFRGMKVSPTTGSRYGDVELTIADNQPNSRKKIFTKIADPDYQENSEKYRQMGMTNLTRMVEAAGIVNPEDAASYEKLNGKSCEAVLMMLDNKYVAIKTKVEPGSAGYEDKNDVGEYLTPNPQSQSHKNFVKLTNGDHGNTGAVAGATPPKGGFSGGAAAPAGQRAGGFAQQAETQGGDAVSTAPVERPRSGFNPNSAPDYLK
jgi:hypothetical protein